MKGQGVVEYLLILILCAVVAIVILAVLGPTVGNILQNGIDTGPCWRDTASVECKIAKVEQCMATEQYTKDQCVTLVGGGS